MAALFFLSNLWMRLVPVPELLLHHGTDWRRRYPLLCSAHAPKLADDLFMNLADAGLAYSQPLSNFFQS